MNIFWMKNASNKIIAIEIIWQLEQVRGGLIHADDGGNTNLTIQTKCKSNHPIAVLWTLSNTTYTTDENRMAKKLLIVLVN